jgi:hypothetical protein
VLGDERGQLLLPLNPEPGVLRAGDPGAEDAVVGEAVQPARLVAAVDRVPIGVQGAQDRALVLQQRQPLFDICQTVDWSMI